MMEEIISLEKPKEKAGNFAWEMLPGEKGVSFQTMSAHILMSAIKKKQLKFLLH